MADNDIDQTGSHRRILRTSSIIGGAAVINIAVGLAKTKFVALLLGPAGLGLIVLLQNLLTTAAAVGALGLASSGTRQLSAAIGAEDQPRIAIVRRALLLITGLLAIAASLVFWFARNALAVWVAPDGALGRSLGWLALGVGLTIAAQAQSALLAAFRRIGDMAWVSIASVVIAAIVGIVAVAWLGEGGIAIFVLMPAAATFVVAHIFVARLPKVPAADVSTGAVVGEMRTLVKFGLALTVAAVGVQLGQLAARTLIQRDLGAEAVGWFQASWLISVTYITFVLQAMGADFYPRLTATILDSAAANRLVNEQTEVAILLAAPVLLGTLGIAPWIMSLLYSSAFSPAVPVLQWQVLGDVLKVASWPLGYLLLAANSSRSYMIGEIGAVIALLAVLALALPLIGLQAGGLAVVGMYLFYLPYVYGVAHVRHGFRWTPINIRLLAGLLAASGATLLVSRAMPIAGALLGLALAGTAGGLFLWRLRDMLPGPVATVVARLRRIVAHG